jgi:ketosteroid isomerase-like protein
VGTTYPVRATSRFPGDSTRVRPTMITKCSTISAIALGLSACAPSHAAAPATPGCKAAVASVGENGGAQAGEAALAMQSSASGSAAATNARIAEGLLALLGGHPGPEDIAALFSDDLEWEIPGDVGALPWLGKKKGRGAVEEFIRDTAAMVERHRFDVRDILVDEQRAVILGELATTVKRTNRTIEGAFAIVLTISGERITHFQMLEDSFAVSKAAR